MESRQLLHSKMWMVNTVTCLLIMLTLSPLVFVQLTDKPPEKKKDTSLITASFRPNEVLVIGDSITAMAFDKVNYGYTGWWEYFKQLSPAEQFIVAAENGSGYTKKGAKGYRFDEQLEQISLHRPKAIVIAGGFNDRKATDVEAKVNKFYTKLSDLLKKHKIPSSNVYTIVPRPKNTAENTIPIVRSNTKAIGATYIEFGGYASSFDGIHPDSKGAKEIYTTITKRSNFDDRLR